MNPDHGSYITTAPEVSADQRIVVNFFCGPEGDNEKVQTGAGH